MKTKTTRKAAAAEVQMINQLAFAVTVTWIVSIATLIALLAL